MDTFQDVINAWPSVAAFSEDIGVPVAHVRMMKRRNSIPAWFWADAIESAKARRIKGVNLTLFADLAKIKDIRS